MRAEPAPSADSDACTLVELVEAYRDCRSNKRNSRSALAFEQDVERNLCMLFDELVTGRYMPGRSICFVVTRPRPREVWAADFRDRIVHHLLYNRISGRFHASFIANSCACIPGRGTLYAARQLEHSIRSITENWQRPAFYLKADLSNFFVAIDKHTLFAQLARKISEPWWLDLARRVLFHDPRVDVDVRSPQRLLHLVPSHKSLFNAPPDTGLPIGNLSSQFFANVHLDCLDQHVKHQVRSRYYVRYVDDFILLHESPQWLNAALASIEECLAAKLPGTRINPRKTILQPIDRGVDFVGHVVKPWRRVTRPGTVSRAVHRIERMNEGELFEPANSYFGLLRQATHSHADRARLARALLKRGHCIDGHITKTFRKRISP